MDCKDSLQSITLDRIFSWCKQTIQQTTTPLRCQTYKASAVSKSSSSFKLSKSTSATRVSPTLLSGRSCTICVATFIKMLNNEKAFEIVK